MYLSETYMRSILRVFYHKLPFFPHSVCYSSAFMCGITVHLFLLLESILVCDSTIVYLPIMLLLDIEDVFSFFATISTSFCSID